MLKKLKEAYETTLLCLPQHPKARIVEPEEMEFARQWLGKHIPVAMNTRNNRRTVGHSGVCVTSITQYVVEGK
jgi:hypothetical protein